MVRPLMQHGVGQLEELFAKAKADAKVLKQLEHELQYRKTPRAVALLAEVQAAMHGASTASPPTIQPTAPALPPVATPVAARLALAPAPARLATPPAPAILLDDAYKLLRASPGTTWESIEQTRRLLIQASHPEKLRKLPESKRAQALTEASRVNAAYAVLSQVRCSGR